jgi:hypothetical protein
MRSVRAILFLTLAACGDSSSRPDAVSPSLAVWTDFEKCSNMCQSYCVHLNACDGIDVTSCRMAIDHADGGDCRVRAAAFASIPQSQVQACIDATSAMSCAEFVALYDTGRGMPAPCVGILN